MHIKASLVLAKYTITCVAIVYLYLDYTYIEVIHFYSV